MPPNRAKFSQNFKSATLDRVLWPRIIKWEEKVIYQVFINSLCTDTVVFLFFFLHWDLSVDKNSLSISPADKMLAEYIQTIDRQRLAGQHVSRLQAGLTGVSAEPGADVRLAPYSWCHGTVWHHAVVSAPWNTNICNTFLSNVMTQYIWSLVMISRQMIKSR